MAPETDSGKAEMLDKAVDLLATLLAELGACPPMRTTCPQRGHPINITICTNCLRGWAEEKVQSE